MASKEIEELIKRRPELQADIQKAGQELDKRGAAQKDLNYDPQPLARQGQARPYAPEPKPGLSTQTKREPNEVDKMLSARDHAATKDAGKELNQQQVTPPKSQDLER